MSNAARYVKQNNWEVKKNEYLNLVDSLVLSHCREKGFRRAGPVDPAGGRPGREPSEKAERTRI